MNTKTALSVLTGLLISLSASAQDYPAAHVASPDRYQVLEHNDEVLVLKMVLKPGETDAMHRHQNETVYFQQGGKLTIRLPDGKSMDVEVPDGHVMWHEAWAHQVSNSGSTDVIAIIVEDKP